ncbi:MAG: hypothetical protein JSV65_01990 [Armatimonadota bacterium]|nr:MAG: hypothetical protein JSV65_01990 [Armatimonadota bacterium]
MRRNTAVRGTAWLAGLVALVFLLGALLACDAEAGFFSKVKGPKASSQKESTSPPSTSSSQPKSGGFLSKVKSKGPTPYIPSKPAPSPPSNTPLPSDKPGFFSPTKDKPQLGVPHPSTPGNPPGDFVFTRPRDGWKQDPGVLRDVTSTPRHGWNSRGYFEQLRREIEARRHRERHVHYWYYPYDYTYYRWYRYHVVPLYVSVDSYGYGYTYLYPDYRFYYAAPTTIIMVEPNDWVYGETYVPYATWPSNDLMEAKRDIERGWRHERLELIDRHLDPDHQIASYLRDEYTHSLSAEEFRQLTLDAFSSIRTVSFELTSARYVSTRYWARLKGKHVFYDPFDKRTVVYVSYLMRRVDYDAGHERWMIWEVRQSPSPD